MYSNYQKDDFIAVNKILNSKKFKEKENKLLYLMELSSVQFYQKQYVESLKNLKVAQNLADSLYTKSIRQLILSSFLGEEYKSFYGKIFERSAMYHLQILNLMSLYSGEEYFEVKKMPSVQSNDPLKIELEKKTIPKKERKKFLLQARSVVLAWDSFYSTLQKDSSVSFFSKDYYQKIISAHIHEELGSRKDLNIALILYENTLKDFDRLVSLYPSFNLNYELSVKNYIARNSKSYVQLTQRGLRLKEFIKFKVLSLTKRISKSKLKKKIKKYKPSEETLLKLNDGKEYISLFVLNKVVEPIKEKLISYNLNRVLNKIEDKNIRSLVEVIGVSTLTYFTLGTLGLPVYAYSSDGHSRSYVYTDLRAANNLVKNIGIDIKIPYREATTKMPIIELKTKGKIGKRFSVINSYSETASIATQEFANKYYSALGPKIALKYLVAIVGAYTTYNTLKKSENAFASIIALSQYYASTKVIANTQSVDVRSWIGIPSNIQFLSISKKSLNNSSNLSLILDGKDQNKAITTTNKKLFFLTL